MNATGLREHKDRIGLAIALLVTIALLPYCKRSATASSIMMTLYVSENPHVQQGLTFDSVAGHSRAARVVTGIR